MATNRLIVLGSGLLSIAMGQQIQVTMTNIPAAATRLVAVVDGGSLTAPLRKAQDVLAGAASGSVSIAVPGGGPYRVRMVAFTAGPAIPAILRLGKITGLSVSSGTVTGSVALSDPTGAISSTTPTASLPGATIPLSVDLFDAGDFSENASGWEWLSLAQFLQNMAAPSSVYVASSLVNAGRYRASANVTAPSGAGTLYFQVGLTSAPFTTSTEMPMLFWPRLGTAGAVPAQISITGGPSLSINLTNIPSLATRIVAVTDTGSGGGPWRFTKDFSQGTSSTSLSIGVQTAGTYRVRVVAFTAGAALPAILRSGMVPAATTSGTSTIALSDITTAVDSSTPAVTPPGSNVRIALNVLDAGRFLENSYGRLWCASHAFSGNLMATDCAPMLIASTGTGSFQITASLAMPTSTGTLYYQTALNSAAFDTGGETPSLYLPNLTAGAPPLQIQVGTSAARSPVLSVGAVHFRSLNGRTPAPIPVSVSMSDSSSLPFSASATSDTGWLSVNPVSGTTPGSITASAVPAGLPGAVRSGLIQVQAGGYSASAVADLTMTNKPVPWDFRGVGRSDLLLYNPLTGDGFTAQTDGTGGFTYTFQFYIPGYTHLRSADFNGDGKADMVVYNQNTALTFVGLSNGTATFPYQGLFWSPNYDVVALGDLNGDGRTDIVLYNHSVGTMYTALSNGDGTFRCIYHLISPYDHIVVGDYNGDGMADLFLYRESDGFAYLGISDGHGDFTFTRVFIYAGFHFVVSGDVNGDGKADIVLYDPVSGRTVIGLGTGSGFRFTIYAWTPHFTSVSLLDFNGDGWDDILLYDSISGNAYLGISDGTGAFTFHTAAFGAGKDTIVVLDLNGDGKMDVVLYNSLDGTAYTGISTGDVNSPFTFKLNTWGAGKMVAQ